MLDRRTCLTSLLAMASAPALAAGEAQNLNDELERLRGAHGLPALAAAAVVKGEIVESGVAGVRVHGADIKATIYDRFHLGSDTKAMTATLAGALIEEGKLNWDSTIGDILGADVKDINPKLAAVTLEQLLSHTGGVPTDNDEIGKLYFSSDAFTLNLWTQRLKTVAAWKDHAPEQAPGTAFHYANLGYLIAGAMIEKAAGIPWEQLIVSRLFAPLGMKTGGLGPQATTGKIDAPVGHQVDERGVITPMLWGPAADAPPVLGPAGVAHMSILDFAGWAGWNAGRGMRGPALVKPETLARIHRPHVNMGVIANAKPGTPREGEYALGWGRVKFDWTPGPVLTHGGSNSMNLATILVDTDRDIGIVAATNFPGDQADAALRRVMETLYRRHAA
jgi:CubicO group peptidase (beta-lactamase class C family)